MTKIKSAIELAEAGFYVFRLKPNAKTPAYHGWQEEATRDPNLIRSYFDNNKNYNIGIFTEKFGDVNASHALTVIDVDTKEGKQGRETMLLLDMMGYDFPPTLTQTTASGGQHLIYTHEVALASGANKLGPHVDLKSAGAYIVGAGSTIDEGRYSFDPNTVSHPNPAPSWLAERCHAPLPKSLTQGIVSDTEQTLARANDYISEAPEISSGGRNDAAFKVAAHIRDFGLSQYYTEELMHRWNKFKCQPPLSPEEITHVTNSAYSYSKLAAGNLSPQNDFTVVPHDPKIDDTTQKGFYFLLPDEIDTTFDTQPLIEDYLDQAAVSILYGNSNTGKTFVALDIAYHVATGTPWNQHFVTQGAVAFLAAEGGRSATNRIQALKQYYSTPFFPLALIPCQINLFDSNTDFKAFIDLITSAELKTGPIRLIVIDTLSRALAGGNENDSQDMGEFVKNITFIKEHFKCHVLIVHHSGKDTNKGARGHSLLRAAVDTEIELTNELITTTKQRDMEFAKPLGFKLNVINLGETTRGKPITSCVIEYYDATKSADRDQMNRLEPRDTVAFLALQSFKQDRPLDGFDHVCPQNVWAELCKDFNIHTVSGAKPWPKSDNSFYKAFTRTRDRLMAFGLVEEVSENQWAIINTGQAVQ